MSLVDTYADWSGTLNDLEAELRAAPAPGAGAAPNARSIRHYQSLGVVDRPGRGRGARYGRRQLLQVLAARRLMSDGWGLQKIGEIMQPLTDGELAGLVEAPYGAGSSLDDAARARSAALDAVGRLRADTSTISDGASGMAFTPTVPAHSGGAQARIARGRAPEAPGPAIPAPKVRACPSASCAGAVRMVYDTTPWLRASVDAAAFANIGERDIDRAVERLAEQIKQDRRNQT